MHNFISVLLLPRMSDLKYGYQSSSGGSRFRVILHDVKSILTETVKGKTSVLF